MLSSSRFSRRSKFRSRPKGEIQRAVRDGNFRSRIITEPFFDENHLRLTKAPKCRCACAAEIKERPMVYSSGCVTIPAGCNAVDRIFA
jgi:hypothetical protein